MLSSQFVYIFLTELFLFFKLSNGALDAAACAPKMLADTKCISQTNANLIKSSSG